MSDAPAPSPGQARAGVRTRLLLAGALAASAAAWLLRAPRRAAPEAAPAPAGPLPTRLEPGALSQAEAEHEAPAVAGYRREVVRPRPVRDVAESEPAREEPAPSGPPGLPAARRRDEKTTLPEIFRMPADPARTAAPAPARAAPPPAEAAAPAVFAPFGRLVKCQLVNTVDSVTSRTEPIVALVTEDLDWNGEVIVPAGTEAFSYARPEPVLDAAGVGRLVDDGEWTLVLPGEPGGASGRELILRARALDRRETAVSGRGRARSWGIDDGADGLVGFTLSTLDNREIRLFAASAVAGVAQGFGSIAQRQETAPGLAGSLGATLPAPTLGNALVGSLGAGATDYMGQLAARIRDEIAKRGVYVRVPAGKSFYLFVEQTIDPRAAAVGLRLPAGKASR